MKRPQSTVSRKVLLGMECVLLFIDVPLAQSAAWLPITIIPLLLLMAVGCWCLLRWQYRVSLLALWRRPILAAEWRRIAITYAVAVPCLIALLWWIKPEALFALPRNHPQFWLLIMVAYPVISVVPQELVYRVFFFTRYRPLFGENLEMVAASATAFAIGHLVFHNWLAVGLTLLGGWLFATTYRRTGSLRLVALEHAAYGWAIFTVGYGEFFYEGTMKIFRTWPQ
ncbi:MAG TPA: CPBP family intramembrane glutamic endopeptidase [Verrucomicrobiae bacterium]